MNVTQLALSVQEVALLNVPLVMPINPLTQIINALIFVRLMNTEILGISLASLAILLAQHALVEAPLNALLALPIKN